MPDDSLKAVRERLEGHEKLCEERHANIDRRFDEGTRRMARLEEKVDKLGAKLDHVAELVDRLAGGGCDAARSGRLARANRLVRDNPAMALLAGVAVVVLAITMPEAIPVIIGFFI